VGDGFSPQLIRLTGTSFIVGIQGEDQTLAQPET